MAEMCSVANIRGDERQQFIIDHIIIIIVIVVSVVLHKRYRLTDSSWLPSIRLDFLQVNDVAERMLWRNHRRLCRGEKNFNDGGRRRVNYGTINCSWSIGHYFFPLLSVAIICFKLNYFWPIPKFMVEYFAI